MEMNKKEFATLVAAIRTYYPRETILPNQQALELWYMELNDLSYDIAMLALREHVHVSKWSPSISEIREQAAKIKNGEIADWGEGWKKALDAIRFYGSYRQNEALESLDDITLETVIRLGYRDLCMSENTIADRARFKDIYEKIAERKKRESHIPDALKIAVSNERAALAIEKAADQMKIG